MSDARHKLGLDDDPNLYEEATSAPQLACKHPESRLEVYHDNDGSISAYCGKCGAEITAPEELSPDEVQE